MGLHTPTQIMAIKVTTIIIYELFTVSVTNQIQNLTIQINSLLQKNYHLKIIKKKLISTQLIHANTINIQNGWIKQNEGGLWFLTIKWW